MTPGARALMPDYLRLVALFGIVVVNVQFIAFSALQDWLDVEVASALDAVALWAVYGLAMRKTYGLFSFMFGVGLGLLMRSAARKGQAFGTLYRNRMLGLVLLGVLHGCLFFPGDILVVYAITGSILYLMRNWEVRRLVRVGSGLLVAQVLIGTPLLLLPADVPPEVLTFESETLTEGNFIEAAIFRTVGFAIVLPSTLIAQGVSALGWFCLGLASVKSGMIDQADHPVWQRARRWCLLPGVALSLIGAAVWVWGPSLYGAALTVSIAPVATLGYLGVIAAISRPRGAMMDRILAAGGASLSIYLGQSIILSTVFSGYGFGLWEEVGQAAAVGIAVAVTMLLMLFLVVWRTQARHGPFEWLLRRITYAGQAAAQTKSGST